MLPALTVTVPALPDCGPSAEAPISVKPPPVAPPSSSSAPGVATSTEPPAPVPRVLLSMKPPSSTDTLPALTRTEPAEPVSPTAASLLTPLRKLPSPVASMSSVPPTVSAISPALPEPKLSVLIEPPRTRLSVPASTVIDPALPTIVAVAGPAAVLALDRICAPVVTDTSPVAAMPIDPAAPLPEVSAWISAWFCTCSVPPARLIVPPVPAGTGTPLAPTSPAPKVWLSSVVPGPSSSTLSAFTLIAPPLPRSLALLTTTAPLRSVKVPALIATGPPSPEAGAFVATVDPSTVTVPPAVVPMLIAGARPGPVADATTVAPFWMETLSACSDSTPSWPGMLLSVTMTLADTESLPARMKTLPPLG